MNQLNVSICIKTNILAILLTTGGTLVTKEVVQIKDKETADSLYLSLLYGIKQSLLKVRNYIEQTPEVDNVIFKINNTTVMNWIKNCYSKEAYQDSFIDVMSLLNEIPMRYTFVSNNRPKAYRYADKKFIKKRLKLSGLDLDLIEEN